MEKWQMDEKWAESKKHFHLNHKASRIFLACFDACPLQFILYVWIHLSNTKWNTFKQIPLPFHLEWNFILQFHQAMNKSKWKNSL